jgi:23S rRNA pseudouridine1911/1915/1917 synthase
MANTLKDQTPDYRLDDDESGESDIIDVSAGASVDLFSMGIGDAGRRLDVVLAQRLPGLSRTRLQALIEAGQVLVDGEVPLAKRLLRGGEQVTVKATPRSATVGVLPEARALPIIFEDNYLLVIDKPPGWVVHPGAGNPSGTLQNFLLAHHPGAVNLVRAGIVHRLDKDTSGLMVIAKTEAVQLALVRMIAERVVQREYLALVRGTVRGADTVDAPIGRHPRDRIKMAVVKEAQGGRPAVTHYRPLSHGLRHTLLRCRLETGRTHQIRVHMAHIRHPIEADPVYAARPHPDDAVAVQTFARQALHATRLAFAHPVTHAPLVFDAAPPPDMQGLLAALLGGERS